MSVPFRPEPYPRPQGDAARRLVRAAKDIADRFFQACEATGSRFNDCRDRAPSLMNAHASGYATKDGLYLVSNDDLPLLVISPWSVYGFAGGGSLAKMSTNLLEHPTFRTGLRLGEPNRPITSRHYDVYPVLQVGTVRLPVPELYRTGIDAESTLREEWRQFFPRS